MSEAAIKILEDKCVGCGACVKACPFAAIAMADKLAEIDLGKCTLCGACVQSCKFEAVDLKKKEVVAKDLSGYKDVWVFAEQSEGHIESITHELLGEGRKLADDLGEQLCAILIGSEIQGSVKDLTERGADKVYVVDDPELAYFKDEPYANVLIELVKKHNPGILLCGASTIGRSLISRVAVSVNTGLTADCTELAIDPEKRNLLQTRPAFGGNIMATIETPNHRPQMATVRHKVMKEAEIQEGREGETVLEEVAKEILKSRTLRKEYIAEEESTVNITEANIIVSGGRGIQDPSNFEALRELAEVLGGGVGASRAAVDSDWIAYSHQVGQTGKTVCPAIYIACGISGQIQHLAGMSSADIIVAINKDPDAPIFEAATFGIVGDAVKIVPMLTDAFRKLLK